MTVFKATRERPARRPMTAGKAARGAGYGLVLGALAAFTAVHAAPLPAGGPTSVLVGQAALASDPAKQVPGGVSVANIDFKRGDGGSGRLVLRFDGNGASPDLRNQGGQVVIDVANAQLPATLQRAIDVSDFATPVDRIEPRSSGGGTTVVLQTDGNFESMAYQTGNEYIVEIVPRAAAVASTASNTGTGVGATTSVSTSSDTPRYGGRPVTFNFQDVPVRTVLQLIAEESNLNVVAADTVQGNVTLRLVNVPWDQALDIVLQAKGLDKRRSGNVVWVAPQAEIAKYEQDREDARIAMSNRVELTTEYIQINYHNATQIYEALTEAKGVGGSGGGGGGSGGGSGNDGDTGFLSPRGRLVADERTNTLMISDTPKKVAEMKELIAVIDRPVDQVVIEARVVVATESFMRELGARFGISGTRDNVGFSGDLEQNIDNLNDRTQITRGLMTDLAVSNPAGAVALSILNAGYLLDVELSAMQEQGRGEVISNPRIVTSNQREAIIKQGQEVGYVTIQPATAGGVATPSVQFKEVVLEMQVTPTITNDGRVFLNLNVKKDEIEGFIDTSIGDVPQISTRQVNTAVLVEDGQTVVVGGVYEFRERDDVAKVPFLGDIPFLGNLFKRKGRTQEKAELLIFVTPKVLEVAQRNHR
ncbi:MAG: type IV pilus secretin PilQ family protein [Lysobacter spongiicola]|nr:type IV pilus secretin PilQ family protein [Lysobacter spongiicola]